MAEISKRVMDCKNSMRHLVSVDKKKEWIRACQKKTLLTSMVPEVVSTHLTSKDDEEVACPELEQIMSEFMSRLSDSEKKKGPICALGKGNEEEPEEEDEADQFDWRWSEEYGDYLGNLYLNMAADANPAKRQRTDDGGAED